MKEDKRQALIDEFDGPRLPTQAMFVYQTLFANFDHDPDATARYGWRVTKRLTENDLPCRMDAALIVRWLEHECPRACRRLQEEGKGHASTVQALKVFSSRLDVLGQYVYGLDKFTFPNAGAKKTWTEANATCPHEAKSVAFWVLPLKPKPNPPSAALRALLRVTPSPLPAGLQTRLYMCGFLESEAPSRRQTVSLNALQGHIRVWDEAKMASGELVKAATGLGNVNWDGQVVWPRDAGMARGATFDLWFLEQTLKQFMRHLNTDMNRLLSPFTRFDDFLTGTLFARAVPPTEHWVMHFNSANLVLQSPRTLAAVSAQYVARTGGNGSNVEWTFGTTFGEGGAPSNRAINPTFRDQYHRWTFVEAARMYQQGANLAWPLSEAALVNMGFSAGRAHELHHLTNLMGTRKPTLRMSKISQNAMYPGFNV